MRQYRLTAYYDNDSTIVNYETCRNLSKARECALAELAFSSDCTKVRIQYSGKSRGWSEETVMRPDDFDQDARDRILERFGWVRTDQARPGAVRRG